MARNPKNKPEPPPPPAIGEVGWLPTEVHPLAALFPMMPDDDLKSLAEHIKANGLMTPVVIDADGVLIDGRNRLAACEIAEVKPTYRMLNGHDPEQFIWGANSKRRNMTKGQTAMIGAVIFNNPIENSTETKTEAPQRGRPDTGIKGAAETVGVSYPTMVKAFVVRDYANDFVADVIAGIITLDVAHTTASARKKENERRNMGVETLDDQAPDLAAKVRDGEINIDQAKAELAERIKMELHRRDGVLHGLATFTTAGQGFELSDTLKKLPEWMTTDEGLEHLKKYYSGGLPDLRGKLEAVDRGLAAVREVLQQIPEQAE